MLEIAKNKILVCSLKEAAHSCFMHALGLCSDGRASFFSLSPSADDTVLYVVVEFQDNWMGICQGLFVFNLQK
jgi:hypothetical protein